MAVAVKVYVAMCAVVVALQWWMLPNMPEKVAHAYGVAMVHFVLLAFDNLCVKCITFPEALLKIVSSAPSVFHAWCVKCSMRLILDNTRSLASEITIRIMWQIAEIGLELDTKNVCYMIGWRSRIRYLIGRERHLASISLKTLLSHMYQIAHIPKPV